MMAPTRYLAHQIQKVVMSLGDFMGDHNHACIGRTSAREDMRKLDEGQHNVVECESAIFSLFIFIN